MLTCVLVVVAARLASQRAFCEAATRARCSGVQTRFLVGIDKKLSSGASNLCKTKLEEVAPLGWQNIDLSNISTNLETIPEKTYTWELAPGAREDESGRIVASATIVNDGEFTGRRLTFSYPNPEHYDWSPRVLKRLIEVMGLDSTPGQNPVEVLNAASGSRFSAAVKHSAPTPEYPRARANLDIFNVKPAA